MRLVKLFLAGLMALALGMMWTERARVIDPYTTEREELDFRIGGLDLDVAMAATGPTPYRYDPAPDTAGASLSLSFPPTPPPNDPVDIAGGTATLSGIVSFDDAPVEGAVVLIERFGLDGASQVELVTDATGEWQVEGARGGRYRVRAYVPGVYASDGATVLFVDAGSTHELATPLVTAAEGAILRFFGPDEIIVGTTTGVAVVQLVESVDETGRIVATPVPGAPTEVSAAGPVTLVSADAVAADTTGTARFSVRCDDLGSGTIVVTSFADSRTSFALPACVPVPPPPPIEEPGAEQPEGAGGDG